jgi:hypothetical protein
VPFIDHLLSARAISIGGIARPIALGRLKVDNELEFGRLFDREIGGLGALRDLVQAAVANRISEQLRFAPKTCLPAWVTVSLQWTDRMGRRISTANQGRSPG